METGEEKTEVGEHDGTGVAGTVPAVALTSVEVSMTKFQRLSQNREIQ